MTGYAIWHTDGFIHRVNIKPYQQNITKKTAVTGMSYTFALKKLLIIIVYCPSYFVIGNLSVRDLCIATLCKSNDDTSNPQNLGLLKSKQFGKFSNTFSIGYFRAMKLWSNKL